MDIFSSFELFCLLQKHTFISCCPGGPTTLLMDQLRLPLSVLLARTLHQV